MFQIGFACRNYGNTVFKDAVNTALRLNTKAGFTVIVVKKLTVLIPDDLHKKLKVRAAKDETSITDIVIKALESAVQA